MQTFVSYARGNSVSYDAAREFKTKIEVNLGDRQSAEPFAEPFIDHTIDPGEELQREIATALDECDFFLCLLSDEYWVSDWCQYELRSAVTRWRETGSPRLLFVLAQRMNIHNLRVLIGTDPATAVDSDAVDSDAVDSDAVEGLESLGLITFLGPYSSSGQLVRLEVDSVDREDQIYEMVLRIGQLGN